MFLNDSMVGHVTRRVGLVNMVWRATFAARRSALSARVFRSGQRLLALADCSPGKPVSMKAGTMRGPLI
jgi:hypothetical protein